MASWFTSRRLLVLACAAVVGVACYQGEIAVDVLARGAHVQPHEQIRPDAPVWVMPTNPFFAAGTMPDGQWNLIRMFEAWKQAGLSTDQAAEVLVFLHEQALPAVTSSANAARRANDMRQAEQHLQKALPDQWQVLSRLTPSQRVEPIDWSMRDPSEETLRWVELLGEISSLAPSITDLPFQPRTLEEARADVKTAVGEAGLKQLNVPLVVWSDPTRLADMAEGLRQANRDLQAITGWGGGVLGLDGRLTLTLGIIDDALVDGHEADGKRLEMETDWGDMAHEWMHALDFVMARKALRNPRFGTLTSHKSGWLRHWRPSVAAQSWWQAVGTVETAGKPWVERRHQAVAKQALARRTDMKGYWTDPSELLAFAWEARVRRLEGLHVLSSMAIPEPDYQGLIAPRAGELAAMEGGWDVLLEQARQTLGFSRQAPPLHWEGATATPLPEQSVSALRGSLEKERVGRLD